MIKTWPLTLMYHGVLPRARGIDLNASGVLDQDAFERQLRWLQGHYRVLHPEEFADALSRGKPIPERSVLVTLDDGFQNVLECALPVAEALNVTLLVFVCSAHLGQDAWLWFSRWRALKLIQGKKGTVSLDELLALPVSEIEARLDRIGAPRRMDCPEVFQQLFDGMDLEGLAKAVKRGALSVGGHTVHHPVLSNETSETRRQEIFENKRALEQITGGPVRLFAYPHGAHNLEIAWEVYQCGYVGAFIVDRPDAHFPEDMQSFQIPRTGINRDGLAYFWWRVIGAGAWLRSLVPQVKPGGVMS